MELVGANEVFCLLRDLALLIGGNEFGTDWRVDDVEEGFAAVFVDDVHRHPFNEMPDEGFGDAGVDAVHAHVVAVVGGPSEREFAQIARANDEAVHLVGCIHENLGALTGLPVFIDDVVVADVVAQVFEMLLTCFGDADFADGHAQALHEVDGVCVGAVGGAEAGHGDSDDASTVEPEAVEGMNADEEGQRGIQAAADAEDNGLGMGVGDAFAQSFRLHAEDFFTPLAQFFSTGDEGKGVDGSVEF